jgi:hypothetical protein
MRAPFRLSNRQSGDWPYRVAASVATAQEVNS